MINTIDSSLDKLKIDIAVYALLARINALETCMASLLSSEQKEIFNKEIEVWKKAHPFSEAKNWKQISISYQILFENLFQEI